MKTSLFLGTALALCAIFAAGGCGNPKAAKPAVKVDGPISKSDVKEDEAQAFAVAYVTRKDGFPKKIEDLESAQDDFKDLFGRIKDGSFVVVWDAALTPENSKNVIIGHERKAPDRGGLVVFGDGTVVVLTSEDFAKRTIAPAAK